MEKKKRIIAIIACVIVIAGVFCISSFAEYNHNEIPQGTVIVFNSTIDKSLSNESMGYLNIQFTSNGNNFTSMHFAKRGVNYQYTDLQYSGGIVVTNDGSWSNSNYRTITVNSDTVVSDAWKNYIINNSNFTFPEPPPPPPPTDDILEKVKETFSFTLTAGTLIISWLVANQIALAGLYLYILIALIGVMKRFFVT